MPRLSCQQRAQLVILHEEGYANAELARRFGVSKPAVANLLAKYDTHGTVEDRQRSGRPRRTTAEQDRDLRRLSLRNPTAVSKSLAQQWNNQLDLQNPVLNATVKRRLREAGLRVVIAERKPLLTYCTTQGSSLGLGSTTRELDTASMELHHFQ